MAAGIIFLMRLDFWKIKEINIAGTERASATNIKKIVERQITGAYFGIFPRNNFLIYPKKAIEKEILDSLPVVHSTKANADLNNNIIIDVRERLAFALWCRGAEDCFLMDESGMIFASATDNNGKLLKYYGIVDGEPIGKKFGEEFFPELSVFIGKMRGLGLQAVAVKVIDKTLAKIDFEDGSYLMFLPFEKNKEALFTNIELFVNNLRTKNGGSIPAFEYIDARYGNKIFFKIKE